MDIKNRLDTLLKISNELNSLHNPEKILDRVMDLAIDTIMAERGFIIITKIGTETGQDVIVARKFNQDLVKDQKAFSQLLTCLKSDNFIRTDGFSFSIQHGMWQTKRQEVKSNKDEFSRWQQVADDFTGSESSCR